METTARRGAFFLFTSPAGTILDTHLENRYSPKMTAKYHPPIYYKVRSVVRWVFWTGIVMLGVVYLGRVVDTQPPTCNVRVNFDFTWDNPNNVDISKCQHPDNVVLHRNGTWKWLE